VTELHGRHLFVRHPFNPIITADHLPYPANTVFNPGAARVAGETVLLLRVEDMRGISSLPGGNLGLRGSASGLPART
jgi:predicted GH43/DUF377 family glycosyl hydrolase